MSFLGDNLVLFFFNENFAFWLKNDIYCSWFMVFLNQFCDTCNLCDHCSKFSNLSNWKVEA